MVLYLSNILIMKTLSALIILLIAIEILILLLKIMQNSSSSLMVFQKDCSHTSYSDFRVQLKTAQFLENNSMGNMEDFNK
jgi:hypothetical protein